MCERRFAGAKGVLAHLMAKHSGKEEAERREAERLKAERLKAELLMKAERLKRTEARRRARTCPLCGSVLPGASAKRAVRTHICSEHPAEYAKIVKREELEAASRRLAEENRVAEKRAQANAKLPEFRRKQRAAATLRQTRNRQQEARAAKRRRDITCPECGHVCRPRGLPQHMAAKHP